MLWKHTASKEGNFRKINSLMYSFIYGYVAGTPEMLRPTMNLFPVNEKSGDDCLAAPPPRKLRSMDLFPNQAAFSSPKDDGLKSSINKLGSSVEPQTAQMTIFYGGQVIVFNDFPADKAKEIMLLAAKGSSQNNSFNPNPPPFTSTIATSPIESGIGFSTKVTQECIRSAQRPIPGGKPHWRWNYGLVFGCCFQGFLLVGVYCLQIYQLQGELHSTGSLRRERIGRHLEIK